MDALDLRIMKVLLADNGVPPGVPTVRKSFRSIAKDLRVDQGTIRSRMKKLQERRILKGWYVGVSPALTGHKVAHIWLEVEPEHDKAGLIKDFVSVAGVERVCNYLGSRMSLVLLYSDEKDLELSLERISKLADTDKLFRAQGRLPIRYPKLTETDLAVVRSLQQDPWKPYPTVARELGFSAKTVKRRVARLSEAGAIYLVPDIDLKALSGIIPVELAVSYESDESKVGANERIASHIRDELVFSQISGQHGYFALMVTNVAFVEGIEAWVKKQNGVSGAHTRILQEVVLNPGHYKPHDLAADGQGEGVPIHSIPGT